MCEDNRRLQQNQKTIFTGGSVIMDYGLVFWTEAMKVFQNALMIDLFIKNRFHKILIGELESCGLLWCFSSLDSHSDGTHSLQMIHWWASDVKLNFSKSVPIKKQINL